MKKTTLAAIAMSLCAATSAHAEKPTDPQTELIYAHLNRVIKKYDLDMIYVSGPGHGGPAVVGNTYLEGTYSEIYPNISQDEAGLRKLFLLFSFPGGIPSHASPDRRFGNVSKIRVDFKTICEEFQVTLFLRNRPRF